jgi:6-phosphogluconolactonase/glucosamine-6-phosphate isomerase/deaminase
MADEVDKTGLQLSDGTTIPAAVVVWAAGVRAYQGHRRMTLTYPALARADEILWLVAGADKHDALARLLAGDRSIPAGRVEAGRSVIFADASAVQGSAP